MQHSTGSYNMAPMVPKAGHIDNNNDALQYQK